MSDEAEFMLRLIDGVSGPAGKAGDSLKDLLKNLGATGKGAAGASGMMKTAFGVALGTAIEKVGEKVLELGAHAITSMIETVDHTQRASLAFDALAKHGASGAKIFDWTRKMAQDLGMDINDTVHQMQHFLAMQFNPAQAEALIKMGTDMQGVGSSAEQVKSIWLNMSQVMAQGKLNGTDLRQFEQAGISGVLVMEALSKQTGIAMDKLPAAISKGEIKAGVALNAIGDAILHKTQESKFGEMGKSIADKTLGGLWGQLKGAAVNVGIDFAKVVGPSFSTALGGIKDVLTGVLASDGFKAFMTSVGGVIKDVAAAMKSAAPAIGAFLEGWSAGAAPGIQALGDVLKQVFGLFGDGDGTKGAREWGHLMGGVMTSAFRVLAAVLPPVVDLFKNIAGIMGNPELTNAEKFSAIGGQIMGAISGTIEALKPMIGAALTEVARMAIPMLKAAVNFQQLGVDIGTMIVSGLAQGIWNKMMAPIDAIKGVGQAVIDAAKGVFDQHSPSRVFADIGAMNVAGFGKGMAPMNDVLDMSVPSVSATSAGSMAGVGGARGASVNVTVAAGAIVVNGSSSPEAAAESVKRMLLTEMGGAFEQLAIEAA